MPTKTPELDEAAKQARAARIVATIIAFRQLRRYLDAQSEHYPGKYDPDAALAALQEALAGADDPGQLRCCLSDAVAAYARKCREGGATNFMSLEFFIRHFPWQPEYLPLNRLAA